MKDIDFDELDKAVNSLMATTKSTPDQGDTVTVSSSVNAAPVPVPSTIQPEARPVTPEPAVAVPAVTPVAVRTTPPAARRTGRFMDMVNKPADTSKTMQPKPTASREGLSITPRAAEPTQPAATQPVLETTQPTQPEPKATFESMPDPIDVQQSTLDTTPDPTTVSDESVMEQPTNPPLGSLDSPFLSDAKVEKRPLNSETSETISTDFTFNSLTEEQALGPEDADSLKDEKGADEPPVTPQVAELDHDLLAIESNEKLDVTQAVDTVDAAAQVPIPSTPLGAASIAQQYTTLPSSGDQSHAAIYDASQYPEPVTHPAKNKSGWLWILWVVLLLGVGAGGALLLYNLGIIP